MFYESVVIRQGIVGGIYRDYEMVVYWMLWPEN